MTDTTLHLRHARTPPDLTRLDVKRRVEPTLLGNRATVAVIGSSHYVGIPEAGFHELCSCDPIEGSAVHDLPLSTGLDRQVRFEDDRLAVATRIEGQPLAAFPGPEDVTVSYRFGPDAYTTIDVTERDRDGPPASVETYHTYPEYDLALYTHTAVERVPNPHPQSHD